MKRTGPCGKPLFSNVCQKGSQLNLVPAVQDARYEFESPEGAEDYTSAIGTELEKQIKEQGQGLTVKRLQNAPELGDQTSAYLLQGPLDVPIRLYYFYFRNGNTVGFVGVSGGDFNQQKAFEIAQKAGDQVEQAAR